MHGMTSGTTRRPDVMMLGLRSVASGQGGVEAHVDHLARHLEDHGLAIEIVVRTPYAGRDRQVRGRATQIVPLWSPTGQSLEAIVHSTLGVLHAARRRPRILHIHAVGPSLVAPLARALGLRVVVTHHGEDYNREKWGWFGRNSLRTGEWCAARFAHARISVSRSLAKRLSGRFGTRFDYVPNGVRLSSAVAGHGALDRFGLEPGGYVLHVSRIVPEKRHLDLIAAFEALDRPDLKLVLVGAADHASAYSRTVTARAAANPSIAMAGFQTGEPLAELFSHAGAFALPSSHEGLPIALLEAMAYGNPVVASGIDANRNVGLPNACYAPLGDVPALTQALALALDRGAGGLRTDWSDLLADYDWHDIAHRTVDIYRQVDPRIAG